MSEQTQGDAGKPADTATPAVEPSPPPPPPPPGPDTPPAPAADPIDYDKLAAAIAARQVDAPAPPVVTAAAPPAAPLPQFGAVAVTPTVDQATELAAQPGYVSAKPLLTTGDYGPFVAELARLLAAAGYPNKVSAGIAGPVLDDELMRIVRAFQEGQGINPAGMQGDAPPLVRRDHEGIVDATTWAALHGHDDVESAGQNDELIIIHRVPSGRLDLARIFA